MDFDSWDTLYKRRSDTVIYYKILIDTINYLYTFIMLLKYLSVYYET